MNRHLNSAWSKINHSLPQPTKIIHCTLGSVGGGGWRKPVLNWQKLHGTKDLKACATAIKQYRYDANLAANNHMIYSFSKNIIINYQNVKTALLFENAQPHQHYRYDVNLDASTWVYNCSFSKNIYHRPGVELHVHEVAVHVTSKKRRSHQVGHTQLLYLPRQERIPPGCQGKPP